MGEKIAEFKNEVRRKKRSARGGSREKKRKFESVLSLPRVDFAKLEELEAPKVYLLMISHVRVLIV